MDISKACLYTLYTHIISTTWPWDFFQWMLLNDIHYVINVTDVTYNFIRNLFAHKFVKLSNQKKIYNFYNLLKIMIV